MSNEGYPAFHLAVCADSGEDRPAGEGCSSNCPRWLRAALDDALGELHYNHGCDPRCEKMRHPSKRS